MNDLAARLAAPLAGTPLAERLPVAAESFLARRAGDAAAERLDGAALVGLARLMASQPAEAGFLSHRPELLERIAASDAAALEVRARELAAWEGEEPEGDLETALDELRILRREETCVAAVLDLGGGAPFEAVSRFLSVLAEAIAARALALALRRAPAGAERSFAVLGMGKIAGRELTYFSDLDLIFLHAGGTDGLAEATRIGQRMISYLATMTGAGIAYAVDTRLRPSGRQGVLVTSFEAFERYQLETAETWEHMALLRARAIAGRVGEARAVLDRVREPVLAAAADRWSYAAELRERVEQERARSDPDSVSLKTGPGGLMDVEFLAKAGLLETADAVLPEPPSVPAMLASSVRGARVDEILEDYHLLRVVQSRARWVSGRAVEEVRTGRTDLGVLAALMETPGPPELLLERLRGALGRIRHAWAAVVRAATIRVLAD